MVNQHYILVSSFGFSVDIFILRAEINIYDDI